MTPRLLQLSGVIIDMVYRVESVPAPGTEANVYDLTLAAGGGFNAMQAARCANIEVLYAGALGTGSLSELARQALATEQIAIVQQTEASIDQGCCTTLVDNSGERTFIAKAGAEGQLTNQHFATLAPATGDWVLVSGYALGYPGSRNVIASWLATLPSQCPLVFDPCPMVERIPPAILKLLLARAWWISANATEAAYLTGGITDPAEAARSLLADRSQDGSQNCLQHGGVVIRLGAEGCMVATADGAVEHCAGYAVDTVDTNGAGDTHVGTFISKLAVGCTAVEAATFANAAAALATTKHGPATAVDHQVVQKFLHRENTCSLSTPKEKGRPRPRTVTRQDTDKAWHQTTTNSGCDK